MMLNYIYIYIYIYIYYFLIRLNFWIIFDDICA